MKAGIQCDIGWALVLDFAARNPRLLSVKFVEVQMRFEEARAILNRHCRQLDNKEASTNKTPQSGPNRAAAQESWWHENADKTSDWRNARTVAYLCAYVEIAGPRIPMEGIPLDDGYIWPDRAVMRALLDRGCVAVDGEAFRVTPEGELLLAPRIRL